MKKGDARPVGEKLGFLNYGALRAGDDAQHLASWLKVVEFEPVIAGQPSSNRRRPTRAIREIDLVIAACFEAFNLQFAANHGMPRELSPHTGGK